MDVSRPILEYMQEQQEAMVGLVRRLARAESPSTVPQAQEEVQALLAQELEASGCRVQIIEGEQSGGHLYAEYGQLSDGTPRQLLLGHSDTVWPIGTWAEMPVVLKGRRLAGPGVFDMKAGLAQMAFALQALHAVGLEPTVQPVLFVNSDEEIGSEESTPHIVTLAREANRVFVLEPALGPRGRLKTARKGVGRFQVVVRGRAAHAGLDPQKGRSAILEMSHVIQKLFDLNDAQRGISVNVGTVDGGSRANVVAPQASAEIDVRVPSRDDVEEIENAILNLQAQTPGVELEVTGQIERCPLERTPRNQALWRLARRCGSSLGLELQEGTAGGASDGNTTSQYAATLDGLGAVGNGAHAAHEFVYVDRMVERAALLALLLMEDPLSAPDAADDASNDRKL